MQTTVAIACECLSGTANSLMQFLPSSFAQLDISALPLNREAKQVSAPAKFDAQFAANWRAPTLETSWHVACAS
jgi:hypothetical protein